VGSLLALVRHRDDRRIPQRVRRLTSDSELVGHGPCEVCGSSDARATYTDGHSWCFACDPDEAYQKGDGDTAAISRKPKGPKITGLIPFDELDCVSLKARKLPEEVCRKAGYFVSTRPGLGPVQVAAYRDTDGHVVAHKMRTRSKEFPWCGEPKRASLFNQHNCRGNGKRIYITEGEIDCLTVMHVLPKWDAVSLPNGAQGARKDLAKHLDFLLGYDEIVLCFDMDEPGREAVDKVVPLFPPGRVRVVSLPLKDANDMLVNDRVEELVAALWNAKSWRPDGIKSLGDLRDQIMREPVVGLPWCLPQQTQSTYGRRWGECVAFGAGTGVGKTDFIMQQAVYDAVTLNQKVGLFFLEAQPVDTGKRLAGKLAKKRFHIPDAGWTGDQLGEALDTLDANKNVFFYDHFGALSWEVVKNTIRVLAHSEGVRIFYLDHLTALAAGEEDERKALEQIMAELAGLCQELKIWMLFVSHLATPEGKPHEEGGRVMIRHFKGSRAIGFWSHFMFGLERNTQADDLEERHTAYLRCLKDRNTGRATGKVITLSYDDETGILFEEDGASDAGINTSTTDEEDPPF
jgi:twinkle protein